MSTRPSRPMNYNGKRNTLTYSTRTVTFAKVAFTTYLIHLYQVQLIIIITFNFNVIVKNNNIDNSNIVLFYDYNSNIRLLSCYLVVLSNFTIIES